MSVLPFIPAAILGAVFCTFVCVCLWVERAERRRARLTPKRRRVFRPVVIQGGKAAVPAAGNEQDVTPIQVRRPNRL